MAFEVPLEADRVDDLNLFSAFVRAPVIGTLMWILGGDKAKEAEEDEERREEMRLDDDCILAPSYNHSLKPTFEKGGTLKKAAPSLIGSEISDIGEVRESLDALCLEHESSRYIPGQPKKSLSWSDELGKDLVEVCPQSTLHEPKHASEQPARSSLVMSRSRSVRSNANHLEPSQPDSHTSTILVMNNPLMMKPTANHHHPHSFSGMVEPYSSGTPGVDSPQWGWYINTTPPTPEMYYARPRRSRNQDSASDTSESTVMASEPLTAVPSSAHAQPNPVFQTLLARHKK